MKTVSHLFGLCTEGSAMKDSYILDKSVGKFPGYKESTDNLERLVMERTFIFLSF